jgi:hypothetical protein
MTRSGIQTLALTLLLSAGWRGTSPAATSNNPPDFKEVYDLVRAHLPAATDADLDAAAAKGLVAALGPRVSLVSQNASTKAASEGDLLSRAGVFDRDIVFLRVRQITAGLDERVRDTYSAIAATNKLKGVVLDLRFTGGDDYAAAAAVADLFISKTRPLLNWGQGAVPSKEKDEPLASTVVVLVNRETAAAAEALAAVLREAGAALILGHRTAGQAMIAQEFALKNGDRLRIATEPILLGDGSAMSVDGVRPDVVVEVNPAEERLYYLDAYRLLGQGGIQSSVGGQTNLAARATRRNRYTEAELVRDRREGTNADAEPRPVREPEPEKPVVRDPALARALDLLKGLAVVRRSGP